MVAKTAHAITMRGNNDWSLYRAEHVQQHTASNFVLESRKDPHCACCEAGTEAASQPLSHAINHSASQPTTQPTNQAINKRTNRPIGACIHSGSHPATQPCNQSLKQTTDHSTIKPTTQPDNPAPTMQLVTHFRREDAQPITPSHRPLAV